jgi:hypothetical protein
VNVLSDPQKERFGLLWTVGFAGKRHIDPAREEIIAGALSHTLDFLRERAAQQVSSLTAVSSIARGGDVIFAELALGKRNHRKQWHWKCVLPFRRETFLDMDLADLDAPVRDIARRRATACLEASMVDAIITSPGIDQNDRAQREQAYLDCGYRVVDESDVVIVLLTASEIADFERHLSEKAPALAGPGSAAVARFAFAARRPLILLNADADDPWQARKVYNNPDEGGSPDDGFFFDPQVTHLIAECTATYPELPDDVPAFAGQTLYTPPMRAVAHLQYALGAWADRHQSSTVSQLRLILTLHLLATGLAALVATKVVNDLLIHGGLETVFVLWMLTGVILLKPGMAAAAWLLEKRLHREKTRETWTQARVLAELCRGGLTMWPLPQQPLDAQDEEDFPRVMRILRTLRLLREQDRDAIIPATRGRDETQDAADMRVACGAYITNRLEHQIAYYTEKRDRALVQAGRWRRTFLWATFAVFLFGLFLVAGKLYETSEEAVEVFDVIPSLAPFVAAFVPLAPLWHGFGWLYHAIEHVVEAAIIVAPFLAAYALATMSLLDCSRRERRYEEMARFLTRMRDTLRRTESNPSRLRLIEHAERSLIEEQHEWFSVMRNLNV